MEARSLRAFDESTVTIETVSAKGTEEMVFARKDIAVIKLAFDF